MEKILTPDERIKRAEDIYYRKKYQDISRKSAKVNVSNKKDYGMFKKIIVQIIICILIYVFFYIIENTNHMFSENILKKVNEILYYDINIKKIYEEGIQYINSFTEDFEEIVNHSQEQNFIDSNGDIDNQINDNEIYENAEIENENINSVEESIGGESVELNKEETVELSQMEQDAKDILEIKSLIIPLKGTITSRFGLRDPETPTVPKNHTGIDIAANEGTVFIASMPGIVEEVSSERRFRKSF